MRLTRYIVSLGWEGFGDRLQCLSHCIWLANTRNRVLVVNWNDRWFGGGFHEFFQLINIPYALDQPEGRTHPSIVQHMRNVPADDWVYDLKEPSTENFECTQPIQLHLGVGYRRWQYDLLEEHMRFHPDLDLAKRIVGLLDKASGRPVVHLRGTDKGFNQESCKALAQRLESPVAIVSDDARAVRCFLEVRPNTIVLSEDLSEAPLHKSAPSREKTLRMLAEFCLLSLRGLDTLCPDSLFWKAARSINTDLWFRPAGEEQDHGDFLYRGGV